ncbi:helix-turn-helix transcriptional regulator [uncultured Jatrophihabitans sp.]|uniref:helix-turn-helix transcriptional regulator n=1 Tax=uncultured Jatrophihabitans sp. TaxID=1610747 RepID=UPI0035CAE931
MPYWTKADLVYERSKRLMTTDEVAYELCVERSTLYTWRQKGVGPESYKYRGGRRVVYKRAAVDAWLAGRELTDDERKEVVPNFAKTAPAGVAPPDRGLDRTHLHIQEERPMKDRTDVPAGSPAAGAPIEFPTSDQGMHPFPEHCPKWCDRDQHLQFAEESEGLYTADEISAHYRHGGNHSLAELRNGVSHEIERDGRGTWTLTTRQHLREPWRGHAGMASPPLVELFVTDPGLGSGYRATLNLTTGEARVLAAQIVALCDRVDLP